MYQRVLIAVDGSPWSDAAAAYAIALASRTGATLRILSVSTTPAVSSMPEAMGAADEMVLEAVESYSLDVLAQVSARAKDAGVSYKTLSKWGNAPEMIMHTAAEEQCDLIVLGSRALTGWKRLMMGDVSNAVTPKAQQPVLVIKQSPPPVPNTPLWRRVLVATGGSPWSDAAVDHAISLAQAQQLEMCVLYVESGRAWHDDDLAAVTSEGKNILALAEARARAGGVSCQTYLAYGNRPAVILETATEQACDVIILGSRGMSGWKRLMLGSVSNAVAAKAALPVLIVKQFLSV
ncbi:MAG: universal stress protein [Candidatus Tectomicrobia bacterium]|nr:universal stress protein [Candidatus Tectomicrobia bacterium]